MRTERRTRRTRLAHWNRRGAALVAALALLALAAALLAGAFAASTASVRATRSARAALVAGATARRALARALIGWSRVEDTLPVGGVVLRVMAETAAVPLDSADTRLVVQRLSPLLYVVAADVTVPVVGPPLARRRMRLLVERRVSVDSTVVLPPGILTRWAVGDVY